MTEQMEQMIYNEGYRRGKEEEHKWWSFHCAKCTNAERPKGEWIDNGDRYFRCSLCGTKDTDTWNWCHGCGCRMKGATHERL